MSKFEKFLNSIRGKTIDVIGLGVSNLPLIQLLCEHGAIVTVLDKNIHVDKSKLQDFDIKYILGDTYLDGLSSEIIFRTPGLNANHEKLIDAQQAGSMITSEMEIFFSVCPCKTIGITGSDGKTTTSTLIAKILENDGYTVHLGGNIGKPLLCDVPKMKENDIAVIELSSFQLQTMKQSPNIAVMTNLTPNHLDMHKDMAEYEQSKKNIFIHQTPQDILITNLNDPITSMYLTVGKVLYFSKYKMLKQGVYLDGDDIYINHGDRQVKLFSAKEIALVGFHNVLNYMTAIAATYSLVDSSKIIEVAKSFTGVEHRIEFVQTVDGVQYYNDSIATSPTRAMAGLNSFDQKVILIAGGYDKNLCFDTFAEMIPEKVAHVVLVGDTAEKIRQSIRKVSDTIPITLFDDFTASVEYAREIAKSGDIVLLSPACAAFDQFQNFAKRGEKFKEIIFSFAKNK